MRDLEPEPAVGETEDVRRRRLLSSRIGDDHHLELEPLGAVDRHQPNGVCAFLLGDRVALARPHCLLLGDKPHEPFEISAS